MKKKISVLLLCLLMLFAVGCGKEETPDYPSLGDVTEPANAEEASFGGFTAQYDADKWVFDNSLGQFAIYDKEDYESADAETVVNINARVSADFEGPFTEKDMEDLLKAMDDMGISGFEIKNSELKTFEGEPVIYYEAETSLTDDMINLLIQEGSITEADIEALGGRDFLKEKGSVKQIGINAVIDGKAVSITGTYNESPDEILDAMKLLIKTGEIA